MIYVPSGGSTLVPSVPQLAPDAEGREGEEVTGDSLLVVCHPCLTWQLSLCPPAIQRVLSDELRLGEPPLAPENHRGYRTGQK